MTLAVYEPRKVFRAEVSKTFGIGHHFHGVKIYRPVTSQRDESEEVLSVRSQEELYELQALIEEVVSNRVL